MDAPNPGFGVIVWNIIICLGLGVFFATGRRRGLPASIYTLFGLTIQLISCVFFLVGAQDFPYEASDYSRLYIQQQVGIWLFFIIISGMVTGLISYGRLYRKILTFAGIMAFSFVFGCLRYFVYLYVISEFSLLYMALLFFPLGPFLNYLYLVFFYSLFVDRLNKTTLARRDHDEVWQWT